MKLLKIIIPLFLYNILYFYSVYIVTADGVKLILNLTWPNFNIQFFILLHPKTFLETIEEEKKDFFCFVMTDFMCIYSHYIHLQTCSDLPLAKLQSVFQGFS